MLEGMQNTLTVAGQLATDVIASVDTGGDPVARFRLAVHTRRLDQANGRWTSEPPTFLTVTCARRLAHNVAGVLRRGDPVIVVGRLRVMRHASDPRRTVVEVAASSVGLNLARTTAIVGRGEPASAA